MIHCHHCNQTLPTGQEQLTDREKSELPMTNGWDVIRWRCVKGAAVHFNVTDWTQEVDRTLTYTENIDLMSIKGQHFEHY